MFEEIADGLDRVLSKADETNAALLRAGGLADEAAKLLTEVMRGSDHLEEEFTLAVQAWSEVVNRVAELSEIIARGCRRVESYRETLRGVGSTLQPALPGQAAPPSATTVPTVAARTPLEPTWAERQREQLPTYVTSGFYRDPDGNSDVVQSGQDAWGEHHAIAEHLRAEGFPPTGPGRVTIGEHVEGKVAWRLRTSGDTHVDLVVNFPMCAGPYSCRNLLPFILKPGQSMTVHDPMKTRTFHGRSTR
ncbi:DddA-like double-stranded DNA deaminase toxin [Lentzea jiangxiensis]|uniref:SCP1.201-like deaminase n=1 Tax=Lentzea jiangxiensis TaxID=641025 RepID=A0A1H0PQZ0_9PSEU|nr:DddA-like double-stranded DNA deaminase toxin [Lentzea jiangxiensis]SDP06966.1 SCP1.201-like deaminase [Lentzea jiangxiensis]